MGHTVDFLLSAHRDTAAAKRFLQRAIEKRGIPQKITLDGSAASHEAVAELQEEHGLPAALVVRTHRYLNNLIEQDHRRVKQRVRPMCGFKRFDYAEVTIAGIELIHHIKKEQFDVSVLCSPQSWPRYSESVTRGKVETQNSANSGTNFAIWCKGETNETFRRGIGVS